MTKEELIEAFETAKENTGKTWSDIYVSSGISERTVAGWKGMKSLPNMDTVQRALKAVGKKLIIVDI